MRDLQDPLPDQDPEFVHEEEQDDVSKIQSLLKELDMSGGVARIFRQRPGQAKHEYEGEIPADTFTLETIKRAYGGGDYQVRFAAKGGRYVRSIRFSIDPRHKGELDKAHDIQTPVTQTNDNSQALLAFMMSQQQAQAQQSQQSMTLMMTMMNESQKSMAAIIAAAIGGGRQVVPDSSNKFIEIMMPMLTESMKPRGGMSELTENVKLVKELMTGAPEKEEKDDMLEKMMAIGAPLIGAFMSRGQQAPPQPQPVRVNPVQPTIPTQEQLAQSKAQDLLGKLRFVTPVLVRAAKKSSYLDSYVDILNDSLDDEGHEMLVYMLQRDDWISTLFNDNPDVVANRVWFERLREAILNPDDEDTADTVGEATPEPVKEPEAPHPFS
jgi:hypothetical protein